VKERDIHFMRLALAEAEKGLGRTAPNPCVGAVVVREDQVVGRGYHRRAGTPHAEVNAIRDAGTACRGATIYVTLEPCNHTGRTPPCTAAILDAGIRRVVIGMKDPNPQVTGGGADYLRSQGLEVSSGLLEEDCRRLNYPFLKHSTTGLPWVIMKAGMSLDARISRQPGRGGAITGKESRQFVHKLRDRTDAILIGSRTALVDDPSLTTRLEKGRGRDPVRIVLDSRLRLSPGARMLGQESNAPTWIFASADADADRAARLRDQGAVVVSMEVDEQGRLLLHPILEYLGRHDITSVLVEGGAAVHGSFLGQGLVDQVFLFLAPYFIGDQGVPLVSGYGCDVPGISCPQLEKITLERLGRDILLQGLLNTSWCRIRGQDAE